MCAIGGAGAVLLLIGAAASASASDCTAALLLLLALAACGAAGGILYDATAAWRVRRWWGRACSWTITVWCSTLPLFMLARLATGALHLASLSGRRALFVTSNEALACLTIAGVLFGVAMAESESTDETVPLLINFDDTVRPATLATWAIVLLVGWATANVLATDHGLRIPDNDRQARATVSDALSEASHRPRDAHAQLVLGVSLTHLRRYAEAERALELASRLAPDDAYSRNVLGWIRNQQGRFADAIPPLEQAVRLDPNYGEANRNLGWALGHVGQLQEAQVRYRQAVRLKPDDAETLSEYASVLFRLHQTALAIEQMRRATKLAPNDLRYHLMTGYMLRSETRFADAKREIEQAVRLDSTWAEPWLELGITNFAMGDAAAANAAFSAAARRDSTILARRPAASQMQAMASRGITGEIGVVRQRPSDVAGAAGKSPR
jgi:Flp pilus assembly protein TadD